MKRRLSLNFNRLTDNKLCKQAVSITSCMKDNTFFPDATPLVSKTFHALNEYMQAMSDALSRDVLKISIKNDCRLKLIQLLKELGEYVDEKSEGYEHALTSSGFRLARVGEEVMLSKPRGFVVAPGPKNGEIVLKVNRVIGARTYLYQYTPDPLTKESNWQMVTSTRCKTVLADLPLGTKFWFRMAAVGPRNQIVYTDVESRYIA